MEPEASPGSEHFLCAVSLKWDPQCCSVQFVCLFTIFRTSAALRSGLTRGWLLPHHVHGTAASHDHPTGSLLEEDREKI